MIHHRLENVTVLVVVVGLPPIITIISSRTEIQATSLTSILSLY